MCFIGHGAFGIITKTIWCNYLAVIGIDQATAYQLMPVIGAIDILMGLCLLFYPIRAVVLWLVLWGLATAAMRPLSGEPFAELLERAGNFGAPLALLLLCPPENGFRTWFRKIQPPGTISQGHLKRITLLAYFSILPACRPWLAKLNWQKRLINSICIPGLSECSASGTYCWDNRSFCLNFYSHPSTAPHNYVVSDLENRNRTFLSALGAI
jgi:hypothetical protein